jgi:hypothetical protein
MLDLHEIVDISEDGVAIQCNSALEVDREVNLCLDLAEATGQIYTSGRVIWSNPSGRSGLRFSELPPVSLFRLRVARRSVRPTSPIAPTTPTRWRR